MKTLSSRENTSGGSTTGSDEKIENFITTQVLEKGLDMRTEKAYRLDLKHLYLWLEDYGRELSEMTAIEDYLRYLIKDRKLKTSTIRRKYRVFCYYLVYLIGQGILSSDCRPKQPVLEKTEEKEIRILSKEEIDAFFEAMGREYESLDHGFRRRVCRRDQVMMELLFYHGMEISELLNLEMTDYNRKNKTLTIRGKRRDRVEYLYSKNLRNKLEQWMDEHIFFEHNPEYHNRLFLSKMGKPLSMKMVILVFDKYRELAGIQKKVTPKDLKSSMNQYAKELMMERCN